MIWLIIVPFIIYSIMILLFIIGSTTVETFTQTREIPKTYFSIVIPFRNEENTLPTLLASLAKLSYPKNLFEIILVDDASTDNSTAIIAEFSKQHTQFPIQLLESKRSSNSPKKDALTVAIDKAQGEWILTTDADCILKPKWLETINSFITSYNCEMLVMPVAIRSNSTTSLLQAYEQLDFLSLMGVTTGSFGINKPFLCNGANLAFEKKTFEKLGGYASHQQFASGDDHFLLEAVSMLSRERVRYLKARDVIVSTQSQSSWQGFISQRVRWASKATGYTYWFSKFTGLLVLLTNFLSAGVLSFLLLLFLNIIIGVPESFAFAKAEIVITLVFCLALKGILDLILIAKEARFYGKTQYLTWYPIVMILYPFVSTFIALRALKGGFNWKGRSYTR